MLKFEKYPYDSQSSLLIPWCSYQIDSPVVDSLLLNFNLILNVSNLTFSLVIIPLTLLLASRVEKSFWYQKILNKFTSPNAGSYEGNEIRRTQDNIWVKLRLIEFQNVLLECLGISIYFIIQLFSILIGQTFRLIPLVAGRCYCQ